MKKRNFIQLLLASPLLAWFKAEKHTISEWAEKDPNVITVEKVQEIARWMEKKRIKPLKLPDGKEYYVWCVEPNRYHRYFINS